MCDITSGVCNGTLYNGAVNVDFTGWIWASSNDIAQLFAFLTGRPEADFLPPEDGFSEGTGDAAWALAAIDTDRGGSDLGLFHYTGERVVANVGVGYTVNGFTRDLTAAGRANRAYLGNGLANQAITFNPIPTDQPRAINGMWLFKAVPEPPVYALLLAGLLILVRRR